MSKHKNLIVYFILVVLVVLFFWEVIFLDKKFIYRDMPRSYYPYKYFVAQTIKEGSFPLWNQYVGCGIPFFASINSGIFYPLSILYIVLPFDVGFNLFYLLHYLLAAIFMYMLAKDFKLSTLASLFTSICFIFCGYFISTIDTPSFTGVVWAPLTFLLFNRSLINKSKKLVFIIFSAFSLSMQILNADPIIVYCIFIICFIYLLVLKEKLSSYANLLLMFLIAIGVSAVQLVPTIELFKVSNRAKLFFESATYWSLDPLHLLNLLVPFSFGDFTLTYTDWIHPNAQALFKSLYFGIFPLLLVFIVIITLSKGTFPCLTTMSTIFAVSAFEIAGALTITSTLPSSENIAIASL